MEKTKKFFSIVFTFVFTMFTLLSSMPAQAAVKKTVIPEVQFASAPVTEYTAGDRVQFNINSPNFGGKVEYRVVLWNDFQKSYSDLWNEKNGYPNRYYTKWQPTGNTIFTLGWPISEPGNYRITVYAKRVGVASSKAALIGMNCDSYKQSVAFIVKPKVTLLDKEGQTYGSSDGNKRETYKGDTKITAKNIALSNAKVEGDLYISVDNAVIKNVSVTGKIVVDPGKNGSTTLENVTAKNIEVLSGGQNSIHIKNVQADRMNISSSTPVRVEADGDTEIVSTSASGYVIFDRKNGTYGTITITEGSNGTPVIEFRGDIQDKVQVETTATIKTGEDSKISNLVISTDKVTDTVKLEGQYDNVEVAKEAKVEIGETAVITDSLKVSAKAEIQADEKADVNKVDIATATNETVKLEGTFAKVEINSESKVEVAADTKIESIVANTNAEINLDKTAVVDNVDKGGNTVAVGGERQVGPSTPPSTGGSSEGGDTTQIISITGISATNATVVTFNSNVVGATIKWNGAALSTQTISGTNTITVPSMTSGANNILVIEKSGYTTFTKNNVVWTAPRGTIELSQNKNAGEKVTFTINAQSITFGGEIAYYQAEIDNSCPEGNWVGVKITAPAGVTPDENAVLTVNNNNCNLNGEPGWNNIIEDGDGSNYFHLYQIVRDISRDYQIVIKWNNTSTETYCVDFALTTTLEVYKTDLENMISGAGFNYEHGASYGSISQDAINTLGTAINTAQAVYDNAINAKTDAVQAGVYAAQDELIKAQDVFFDAFNTTVEVVSDNMAANTTYTAENPLIMSLSLENGIGDFVPELKDKITLDGNLLGMAIESVDLEGDPVNPDQKTIYTRATLKLIGTLGDSIDNRIITIAEGGVNGHKHGFEALWTASLQTDVTSIGIKQEHEAEVAGIRDDADVKRITVWYPLTAAGLKNAIESTNGSTQNYAVTDCEGNAKDDDAVLVQDDNLIVTSEDGLVFETYTIRVFGTVNIEVVTKQGETTIPVSKPIISMFNENNEPIYFIDGDGNIITETTMGDDGKWEFFINAAKYLYRIKAEGYDTQEGEFIFSLDHNPLTVTVTLSAMNLTTTTIRVKDAEEYQQKVNLIVNDANPKFAIIEYPTTVGELMSSIESTNGSSQTYEITNSLGIPKVDNELLLADGDILTVTAADKITKDTYIMSVYDTMTFTVTDGTVPVEGAVINIYYNDELFDLSYVTDGPESGIIADAEGKCVFNVPCTYGTYTYRVTADEFEPQVGSFTPGQPDSDVVTVTLLPVTESKEITGFTELTVVNLGVDEHLVDLAALIASSKLPTKVTLTDGITPVEGNITDWTGDFDGTQTGAKTLTATWTMPEGYADVTEPVSVTITVNVNTAQATEVIG